MSDLMPHATEPAPVAILPGGGQLHGRAAGVLCPACQTPLQLGRLDGRQIAGCASCQGMLLQSYIFADVLAERRAARDEPCGHVEPLDRGQLDVRRDCPACDHPFETHPYGGPGTAVIDSCIRCGLIWLDRSEFLALVRAPKRRG